MSRVILYSSLFGSYDIVRPLVDVGCDAVMFTDAPHNEHSGSWIIDTEHVDLVKPYSHPRLKAKYFKMHPFEFFKDYDVSVWLDASWIVQSPMFVKEIVELLNQGSGGFTTAPGEFSEEELDKIASNYKEVSRKPNVVRVPYGAQHEPAPIAFFPHRWRNNVRDELQEHLKIPKYAGLPIVQQVKSYLQEGFPDNIGLAECTCIPSHHNDERVKTFYRAWWDENVKWSYADQLSVGYCAWKTGLPFAFLPMNLAQQRWFTLAAWRGDR